MAKRCLVLLGDLLSRLLGLLDDLLGLLSLLGLLGLLSLLDDLLGLLGLLSLLDDLLGLLDHLLDDLLSLSEFSQSELQDSDLDDSDSLRGLLDGDSQFLDDLLVLSDDLLGLDLLLNSLLRLLGGLLDSLDDSSSLKELDGQFLLEGLWSLLHLHDDLLGLDGNLLVGLGDSNGLSGDLSGLLDNSELFDELLDWFLGSLSLLDLHSEGNSLVSQLGKVGGGGDDGGGDGSDHGTSLSLHESSDSSHLALLGNLDGSDLSDDLLDGLLGLLDDLLSLLNHNLSLL